MNLSPYGNPEQFPPFVLSVAKRSRASVRPERREAKSKDALSHREMRLKPGCMAALVLAAFVLAAAPVSVTAGVAPAGEAARAAERVTLAGEFARPGAYTVRKGERLSELIRRAGGLTAVAFPYGAVFTRERVKRAEEAALRRAASEVDATLAALKAKTDTKETRMAAFARMSARLRAAEPVGRVVVEADPTLLRVRPDLDTVLEPGDRLFVPRRPNYVTVVGGVQNPSAVRFQSGLTAADYVRRTGGFQATADDSRVFVVLPNGEAHRVGASLWNYQPLHVPPGSTIIVPDDPASASSDPILHSLAPIRSLLLSAEAAGVLPERR